VLNRRDLQCGVYDLFASRQIAFSKGKSELADHLLAEAFDLERDIERLANIPESKDQIAETHIRFLARCRLLNVGPYRINAFVGAGQCGAVYKAQDCSSAEECVVKLLCFPRSEDEQNRFAQEGNVLYRLQHETIVKALTPTQTIEYVPVQWFAMEYISNAQTLGRFSSTVSLATTVKVLAQVCEGLAYAHAQGVIHRDLHLDNILIKDGKPKILDFGSAKVSSPEDLLATFRPLGTLRTCSPEKFQGEKIDGKSDVFSIGCIMYYCATKRWPFFSRTFGDLMRKLLSGEFESGGKGPFWGCVAKTLSVDPDLRPAAAELAVRLAEIGEVI